MLLYRSAQDSITRLPVKVLGRDLPVDRTILPDGDRHLHLRVRP
jgi:hypothetical protein